MKTNKNYLMDYFYGKIGLSYFSGAKYDLAKIIEPGLKHNYGYYKRNSLGEMVYNETMENIINDGIRYIFPENFFEYKEIQSNQTPPDPSYNDSIDTIEYRAAKDTATRMYQHCEYDLLLTFKVLKKLVQWSRVESIRARYISAALVLTELYLTEFKTD
jgi:hypothetical protein